MLGNHNQYGRSILEMLGVLAVVGILSVIGVKSFHYAMERHRVNELAEEYIGFIQNLLPYETDFVKIKKTKSPEKALYLVPYLRKMNIIPPKWQIVNGNYLRDSIGVLLDPLIRHEPGGIRENKITWNYIKIGRNQCFLAKIMRNNVCAYRSSLSRTDKYGGIFYR